MVFDAHNVFPDGENRVYTNVLHFRTAEEFRSTLASAGFTGIAISGESPPVPGRLGMLVVAPATKPVPTMADWV